MKVPASKVRAEIDTLNNQVATIRNLHYEYVDRVELDTELDQSAREDALTQEEAWLEAWQTEYRDEVKLAITYIESCSNDSVSNVSSPAQSSAAIKSDGESTASGGLEKKLVDILTLKGDAQRPPSVQVPVYDGNPKNYTFFITTFEELIAKYFDSPRAKLAQLFCHVQGEALMAIHHAMSYPEDKCYERALEVLKTRFGDKTDIARVALDDLINGPSCVSSSDLCTFVEELGNTKRMVDATVYANALDSHEAIDKLLVRLPVKVHDRWTKYALKYKKQKFVYPGIAEFQQFITDLADEFGDRMYGSDSTLRRASLAKDRASGKQSYSSPSFSVSGTARKKSVVIPKTFTALQNNAVPRGLIMPSELQEVRTEDSGSGSDSEPEAGAVSMLASQKRPNKQDHHAKQRPKNCPYCKESLHDLNLCKAYKNLSHVDRWDRVKLREVHICFKCLKLSCDFKCKIEQYKCCALPYHILLHSDHCRKALLNMMFVTDVDYILPTVEIYVNQRKVLAYLDTCSTHSFISEKLVKIAGINAKYESLGACNSINGCRNEVYGVVDLTVQVNTTRECYDITDAFIVPRLPDGKRATRKDLEGNPHLRGLPLAESGEDVEILALIGQDHSYLLTPLEVRRHPEFPAQAVRNRPYAVRTLLGWAISGRGDSAFNLEEKVVINGEVNGEMINASRYSNFTLYSLLLSEKLISPRVVDRVNSIESDRAQNQVQVLQNKTLRFLSRSSLEMRGSFPTVDINLSGGFPTIYFLHTDSDLPLLGRDSTGSLIDVDLFCVNVYGKNFILQSFASNARSMFCFLKFMLKCMSKEVSDDVPEAQERRTLSEEGAGLEEGEDTSVLRWHTVTDYRWMSCTEYVDPHATGRVLLRFIKSMSRDPEPGASDLLMPVIFYAKRMLGSLIRRERDWLNVELTHHLSSWSTWFDGLQVTNAMRFPLPCCTEMNATSHVELHAFSGAVRDAYGIAIYQRVILRNESIVVKLMGANAIRAPAGETGIHSLSLCAALAASKRVKNITKDLGYPIDEVYFWTDDILILHLLRNPVLKLRRFIAGRVDAILDLSVSHQWHYVTENENPAKLVSMGVRVPEDIPYMWMNGPAFLKQRGLSREEDVVTLPVMSALPELRNTLHAVQVGRTYVRARDLQGRWVPATASASPDGREYMVMGSRNQVLHYRPEVASTHRVPPLKSACYSGEHSCLIAVSAPEHQPITLIDAFCFTCEKSDAGPIDGKLEPEPEVSHHEADATSLMVTTRSQSARGLLKKEVNGVKSTGCDIITVKESTDKTNLKKYSSPVDPDMKKVSEYMMAPWPSRPHLIYADPIGTLIRYHGDMNRLCKSFAWWRRWCRRARGETVQGPLTLSEMKEAELLLVRHVQHDVYSREIEALKRRHRIPASSDLLPLNPALDDGMLVVQGRLRNLASADVNVQPYILPKRHHLSVLICRKEHYSSHVGSEWTLTMLRRKYWIIAARSLLRNIRRTCVTCQRYNKPPEQQKMADLPPERLVAGPVCFINTGVDLFGPFLVTHGRGSVKRWGVVFTCMSARAIHLEVVHSMDTDSFIMALMRFVSRRGLPIKVLSDRGTNIVGAETEVNAAWSDVDTDSLALAARSKGIEWKFNPPKASNMGGAWERQIRTIRSCLNSLLRTQNSLDDETLYTSFVEVENLINSRPLTKVSADPEDGVLTPNHLLILQDNADYTAKELDLGAVYRRKWKRVMQIRDQFWKAWTSKYLQDLQLRHKWHSETPDVAVGDVVLQVEAGMARGVWPLAVVTSVNTSHDGKVRSVEIKTQKSNYSRPVNKLVRLELDQE